MSHLSDEQIVGRLCTPVVGRDPNGYRLNLSSEQAYALVPTIRAMLPALISEHVEAAERALVETLVENSERPEPEAMSNAEGEAWDLLHADTNIICTCDGCNFYSPTYDDRAECSLNIYIEDIVLARVRFALRAALAGDSSHSGTGEPAATTEEAASGCLHCGNPIRQRGSKWEHYSPTWQGRRCPNRATGATPRPAAPSTDAEGAS